MEKKKIVGWILIVFAIVCLVFLVLGIHENIAHTSTRTAAAGKITTYKPPFYAHGLLMIIMGVVSVGSFLGGILLLADAGR